MSTNRTFVQNPGESPNYGLDLGNPYPPVNNVSSVDNIQTQPRYNCMRSFSLRSLSYAIPLVLAAVFTGRRTALAESVGVPLAAQVQIYRDAYGTPHVDGQTDAATLFGFAYAQAEDNFWQLEDNYILALGRYSEIHGPRGLNSDLLNRAFEIVPRAQANYATLEPELRPLFDAFAEGLNFYLAKHPDVKPRLIQHFEPWHVLAFGRHITLELCYRYTRLHHNYMPRTNGLIWAASGSNGWAVGPSRTKSGHAMLFANPHLPWFGFSTMYEAHLRSGEGWSFTGATVFGNPMLTLGHNEHLGWTLTTNEPDIADVWVETFDDPADPLKYRSGSEYRIATAWTETILVKAGAACNKRVYEFRKTHHGPIVANKGEGKFLSAQIAGIEDAVMLRQTIKLVRSRNLNEFKSALAVQQFPMMNILYADKEGNIGFVYNGLIPRRDDRFDWSLPVDGADKNTEWQGVHKLEELPQVFNPRDGYVQNCNSSPFTTCELENPQRSAFPKYMAEDADDDKRRAKRARELLGAMKGVTLDEMCVAAFDTTIYWAKHALPEYERRLKELKKTNPVLAKQVEPYLLHLLKWDCRVTAESTQATLCATWYEELYSQGYPAETLLPKYVADPQTEFNALILAAARLVTIHGDWRVPWGDVHRIQRPLHVVELLDLPFDDAKPSLPCLGAPGPMGVIFTQYYSPSLRIPFVRTLKQQYGMVGASYSAVYEFGDKIRGASVMNFGESGDPSSPHYFDQAELISQRRMKPELFDWPDVLAGSKRQYHPGDESQIIAKSVPEN
jgi:acyl-homoserine-lactone acylase